MESLFSELGRAAIWALASAIFMGLGTGLAVKLFDLMTPGVDEMEELRKGNVAVAIVIGSVIIAIGFVMGMVLSVPTP